MNRVCLANGQKTARIWFVGVHGHRFGWKRKNSDWFNETPFCEEPSMSLRALDGSIVFCSISQGRRNWWRIQVHWLFGFSLEFDRLTAKRSGSTLIPSAQRPPQCDIMLILDDTIAQLFNLSSIETESKRKSIEREKNVINFRLTSRIVDNQTIHSSSFAADSKQIVPIERPPEWFRLFNMVVVVSTHW